MQKNLTTIGNSLGIVIEKPILELLGITKDTPLEMKTVIPQLRAKNHYLQRHEILRAPKLGLLYP